ncbi:hypothetical protein [Streptomyces sp. MMBL 11-1]|uniref:hypothetical protein n=1 Tax=Streptomyces sp. MMBL 11-1 TaxID=3026420 RepID=UPI0023620500|nr:hypothetical protein [Streptomyces sp. MMBL 11-1]
MTRLPRVDHRTFPLPPKGVCQRHSENNYVSDDEYARHKDTTVGGLVSLVFRRSEFEIRPLTAEEAAEVAHEAAAAERWEAEGRIGAFRRIVELHQAEEIDGVLVDAFSAQHVIAVHDALKPEQQRIYATWDVYRQVDAAFKLTK